MFSRKLLILMYISLSGFYWIIEASGWENKGRIRIGSRNANISPPVVQPQSLLERKDMVFSTVNLPNGFNPEPPPEKPLLYPFATQKPQTLIVVPDESTQRTIPISFPIPIDRDLISIEAIDVKSIEVPSLASVVYGEWRPDAEAFPAAAAQPSKSQNHTRKERPMGALEAMLMGRTEIDGKTQKQEDLIRNQQEVLVPNSSPEKRIRKHGRQKIKSISTKDLEVEKPQMKMPERDDLQLKLLAHELNHPIQRRTFELDYERSFESNEEEAWQPMMPTHNNTIQVPVTEIQSRQISATLYSTSSTSPATSTTSTTKATTAKIQHIQSSSMRTITSSVPNIMEETTLSSMKWPTDFLESTPLPMDSQSDESINTYNGDSTELPNLYQELNLAENLIPQLAVNITKVGIPYEEKNSAEEPTVCVPLTVRESVKIGERAIPEIVEVERVYCFPLPLPEVKVKVTGTTSGAETAIVTPHNEHKVLKSSSHTTSKPFVTLLVLWSVSWLLY